MRFPRGNALDLRVQAGKRNPGVKDLQDTVHIADFLFHQPQGLGHMTRKPLNLAAVDDITLAHSTAPILLNGIILHRATPSTSRVSTQPISRSRLSLELLRLSPMMNRHPSGTVMGKFTLS